MKSVCQYAYDNEAIDKVPIFKKSTPVKERYQAKTLENDEAERLLYIAKGTKLELVVVLGLMFGVRRSEIIGLHWSDFDFEKRTLTIHRTVTRQRDESGHWADIEEESTKTYFSKSVYELNDVACLYFWMKKEESERMPRRTQEYSDCVCVD